MSENTDTTTDSYLPELMLECRMLKELLSQKAFSSSPLTIGDVGVRFGFDSIWSQFGKDCSIVGFEADSEEANRLRQRLCERIGDHPVTRIEEALLWEKPELMHLLINAKPETSSCYPPNMAFINRLPDQSEVKLVSTLETMATNLDTWAESESVDFDVLKLDVQGAELSVLKGALNQLKSSVLCVITEVEFIELYKGQPLFEDVNRFLKTLGFELFDLDIRKWRRKKLNEEFSGIQMGQVIYADALYFKDPVEHGISLYDIDDARTKLLKLAALAELYALPDYSIEIIEYMFQKGLIDHNGKKLIELLQDDHIASPHYRMRRRNPGNIRTIK